MKKNFFFIIGVAYIVFLFIIVGLDFGKTQPALVVGWDTMLGGVASCIIPFALGFLAGRE